MKLGLALLVLLLQPLVANALPPPDLILSLSQSVLSSIGIAIAGVIVALGSLRVYFQNLFATKIGKIFFYGSVALLVLLICTAVLLYINNVRLNSWRNQIDAEVRSVWEQYAPIYEASDEKDARSSYAGAAQEVTWPKFESLTEGQEYLVVDIRDTHPFEAGHIEGSIHIRLADLIRGRWEELEAYKETPIFIVCYLGSTGAIASDFLAERGFTELYQPKEGLRPTLMRDRDVPFVGSPNVPELEGLVTRISVSNAVELTDNGARVIDLRSPKQYDEESFITPDQRMFREFMTIPEITTFVERLNNKKSYVLLCNSDASCYQAEMLLLDLRDFKIVTDGIFDTTRPEGARLFRPDFHLPQ